jgi:uncharacterized phage protein (TIGR01671 family)
MRDIQFRAWDGKRMWQNVEYSFEFREEGQDPFETPIDFNCFGGVIWSCRDGDAELMQFTGLKDKNGVEIYEGDIVRIDDADRDEDGNMIPLTTEVFYKDACFNVFRNNDESLLFSHVYEGTVEVVGNIHENPDLLAQK